MKALSQYVPSINEALRAGAMYNIATKLYDMQEISKESYTNLLVDLAGKCGWTVTINKKDELKGE